MLIEKREKQYRVGRKLRDIDWNEANNNIIAHEDYIKTLLTKDSNKAAN